MPSVTQRWMVATRRPSHERVTIADVAREAGVNKGTVSRALRGVSGVGPTTRQRILATADRLEFSASHLATTLATGTSQTVGIVLPTLRSWYFSEVAAGASEVLIPSDFRVDLVNLDVDSDVLDVTSMQFRALFRELGAGRGRDALLFAGTISTAGADQHEPGSALVPVAASGLPITEVPGIYIDHRAGGVMVADHLLALGHRRFAILDGRMPHKSDGTIWAARTEGFVAAVRAAGGEVAAHHIIRPGDCHAEDGERAALELFERGPLPTAVFCHTDEMAFALLSVLRRRGVPCPGQLSVVGFDGHPLSWLWGLTTVTQHAREQGSRAARALLSALGADDGAWRSASTSEVRIELVVRETTGPPRDSSQRPPG